MKKQLETLHQMLMKVLETNLKRITSVEDKAALKGGWTVLKYLTLDFFDSMLGMLQRNITRTKIASPLYGYFEELFRSDDEHIQHLLEEDITPNLQKIADEHGTFMYASGLGNHTYSQNANRSQALYPTHHYFNHSCDPNAENGVEECATGSVDAR